MLKKAIKKAQENKKGFTLAELLIVVAIIAVLVAISIPIFTTQLEKSRDAVSVSNIRAAYAEASSNYLTESNNGNGGTEQVENVVFKGTQSGWNDLIKELPFKHVTTDNTEVLTDALGGQAGTYTLTFTFGTDGTCTLTSATMATSTN